jgi:alkyl sulfatase
MTTTQVGTKLGIRKITARIGAEITGLASDLILEPETIAEVRAALNEHKALVFRGVRVDDEDQQRFAGYFGPLTSAHPTVPAVDGEPNVLPVDSEDTRANHWHTDVTFVLNPPQASTLRSIEAEGVTGLAPGQSWPAGTRVSVRILAMDPDRQRFSLTPA